MIVDSSALVAALELEPEADRVFAVLGEFGGRISSATLVEARIVMLSKAGVLGVRRLDSLLRRFAIEVCSVDQPQADAATDAYLAYGRGSGHPAKLNYGDTFSYALASVRDEPLLFVGDDFSHTDIRSALEELAGD